MNVIITSDLHGRWEWYSWLARQQVDLIVIAGDLIDLLGCDEQEIDLCVAFLACFQSPVAVCSGNHDNPAVWFPRLEPLKILCDGQSKIYGKLLVTCLPFEEADYGANDATLGAAQKRAEQRSWLVVHHDPPCGTSVGGNDASTQILRQIKQYRPQYLASGHWHKQPYVGRWCCRSGATICFNAGQPEIHAQGSRPNCIYLDISGQAWWKNTNIHGEAIERLILD